MARINWNRRSRRYHTPWYESGLDPITDRLLAQPEPDRSRKAWKAKRSPQRIAPLPGPEGRLDAALAAADVGEAGAELLDVRSCIVHTDGCCEPNPGIGGWGLSIEVAGMPMIELSGGEAVTTNNRMEMTAAIVALSVLPATCAVTIISDSQYLVKGATVWMDGWKRKDFKRKDGLIPNADLWRALDALAVGRTISWEWVRGHDGHAGNERADQLAATGRGKADVQ